jgi:y4mF family transcriptional regulator
MTNGAGALHPTPVQNPVLAASQWNKIPDQEYFWEGWVMVAKKIPFGTVTSAAEVGQLVARRRKAQGLTQAEVAGLGRVGNRFVSELERGKSTLQFDKVLHVLNLLGLDAVIVERGFQSGNHG